MGTKSVRLNKQEEIQLQKITEHYHTTYREFIKKMIHEKAEDLADIYFIENTDSIGNSNTISINNPSDYLKNL